MGSRRSNPSVKPGQKNPIDSNTIRSSSLRDYTPSASPRHNLDTVWLRGHSEGFRLVYSSPRSRFRGSKTERGERVMTSILDFHDYPEIETDGVAEMSIVRHTAWLRMFRWRRIDGLWRAVVVAL